MRCVHFPAGALVQSQNKNYFNGASVFVFNPSATKCFNWKLCAVRRVDALIDGILDVRAIFWETFFMLCSPYWNRMYHCIYGNAMHPVKRKFLLVIAFEVASSVSDIPSKSRQTVHCTSADAWCLRWDDFSNATKNTYCVCVNFYVALQALCPPWEWQKFKV